MNLHLLTQLGVEIIPHPVTDEIGAHGDGEDGEAREGGNPPVLEGGHPVADHGAPFGRRGLHAQPQEGQTGEHQNGVTQVQRGHDHQRPDAVGQNLPEQDPHPGRPHQPAGRHIVVLLDRNDDAAGQPGVVRPPDDRHGEHRVDDARPHGRGDDHGEDQGREGLDHLAETHHHVIHDPADIAGHPAVQQADAEGNQHGDKPRRDGDSAAVQHPAEYIAPQAVGAEPVRRPRRLKAHVQILRQRIGRGDERRDESDDHPQQADDNPQLEHKILLSEYRFKKFHEGSFLSSRFCELLIPHPRIDDPIQNVDDKVNDHIGQGDQQRHAADGREIQGGGRQIRVLPDARPGENLLHEHHAAQQVAEPHARHGDDRDKGVAQRMVGDDPPFAHPLGPGRADVVGGYRLQQVAAGLPGDEPHGEEPQHKRR